MCFYVAPYIGAWIEIRIKKLLGKPLTVAPYIGAWIEISAFKMFDSFTMVAPYIGAWIEMTDKELALVIPCLSHLT